MVLPRMNLTMTPNRVLVRDRAIIKSSLDAAEILRKLYDPMKMELREEFYLICLNRSAHVIGWEQLSVGGTNGTIVDTKILLGHAVLANASSIIISHNHPSGGRKPSQADINMTKRIAECCRTFDIVLADHIIMTAETYFSFADEGML